jgi:hypothetical protein
VQARLKSGHQRKYPELDPAEWYTVAPIFPGVTQRMVNMAGERLTRLATPRGFLVVKAQHLDFRYTEERAPAPAEGPDR